MIDMIFLIIVINSMDARENEQLFMIATLGKGTHADTVLVYFFYLRMVSSNGRHTYKEIIYLLYTNKSTIQGFIFKTLC
jgi:hypothetical protein